ncbi:hypothetical protein FSP39_013890 [Pinctada imbricata]|uniref:TIR domain-containing protein n=1 Tax=Pinctada imbricata TaxID=66713 RepID=A0AA89BMC3_PINIB|nr:hypothetical protein FSP39_013890 [Pinctada imbricata]
MVAIGYRNKAVVIYLYLMAARRIKKQRHLQDSGDNYTYDVFLSYSHLDCDWVIGSLFQYLTQELSLQVCMYQKDFIPGESIAEEILRSIDSSRKSVFVITRNFLESKWSMFEMELARQHVFMNDSDTILIILKDDIQVHELPNLLKKI